MPPDGPDEEGVELEIAGGDEASGLDAATEVAKVVYAGAVVVPTPPNEDFWKKPAGATDGDDVAAVDCWNA